MHASGEVASRNRGGQGLWARVTSALRKCPYFALVVILVLKIVFALGLLGYSAATELYLAEKSSPGLDGKQVRLSIFLNTRDLFVTDYT